MAGHGGNPLPEHRDGLLQQDLLHLLVLLSQEHARIQRLRGTGTLLTAGIDPDPHLA